MDPRESHIIINRTLAFCSNNYISYLSSLSKKPDSLAIINFATSGGQTEEGQDSNQRIYRIVDTRHVNARLTI